MLDDFEKIWADQAEFNLLFREPPKDFKQRSQQTRDMVLELTEESHELLRTMDHKHHRKLSKLPNASHSEEELADMFKYFISLCQIHEVTPERLKKLYWQKSMVCRQRHAEEWVTALDRPCVIIDLDAVLCDYVSGILDYIDINFPSIEKVKLDVARSRGYVNAETLGIDLQDWELIKWHLRTGDAKEYFPPMPGAKEFVEWCKSKGWLVIILTSRPIDIYPNLYGSTLAWLYNNHIHPDFVWWSGEKHVRIHPIRSHIVFAVDDDQRFIQQYSSCNIPSYWLTSPKVMHAGNLTSVTVVHSLSYIITHYEENHPCPAIPTPDTAPTLTIEEKYLPPLSIVAPRD